MLESNISSKNPKKLRVSVIGTVGVPACYGGFESLVDNLLDFTPLNVEYTVFCSGRKYGKRLDSYKGAKLVYLEMDANGKDSIFYDFKSMKLSVAAKADIMLVLGVSGCIFLPYVRRIFKGKIITNIDGLEWRRGKWKWYAKKLLKLTVNDGSGTPRQVVSGIAPWYKPEDLIGKSVIIVANLKPAKLCGEVSNGMILAGDVSESDVKVVFVDMPAGTKIR